MSAMRCRAGAPAWVLVALLALTSASCWAQSNTPADMPAEPAASSSQASPSSAPASPAEPATAAPAEAATKLFGAARSWIGFSFGASSGLPDYTGEESAKALSDFKTRLSNRSAGSVVTDSARVTSAERQSESNLAYGVQLGQIWRLSAGDWLSGYELAFRYLGNNKIRTNLLADGGSENGKSGISAITDTRITVSTLGLSYLFGAELTPSFWLLGRLGGFVSSTARDPETSYSGASKGYDCSGSSCTSLPASALDDDRDRRDWSYIQTRGGASLGLMADWQMARHIALRVTHDAFFDATRASGKLYTLQTTQLSVLFAF